MDWETGRESEEIMAEMKMTAGEKGQKDMCG